MRRRNENDYYYENTQTRDVVVDIEDPWISVYHYILSKRE